MADHKPHITPEKAATINSLSTELKKAPSAVFVTYAGMGVKAQQDLKKKLKDGGSTMLVAKNTLLKLAAKEAGYPEEVLSDSLLTGQTAVVLSSDDAVSPVQILGKFIAENELPQFKAGVVEGAFYDKDALVKVSKLPSKEVLYAQVVGAVAAPMYAVVGTLQANIQKLLMILKTKAAQAA
jgi:large subunit ribosomal protein L10